MGVVSFQESKTLVLGFCSDFFMESRVWRSSEVAQERKKKKRKRAGRRNSSVGGISEMEERWRRTVVVVFMDC